MSRNLMPQSGALAPYVVVNRDAAVAGVFSVDGLRGSVDLTTKYLTIANFNAYKSTTDGSISSINQSITALNTAVSNKAAKGANSDITSITGLTTALDIAYGGTGGKTAAEARTNLGLTTAATTSIGTDGARIPLLNGVNTWAANQTFSGPQTVFSNVNPGGIEIGSLGTAGIAYIDLHSSGTSNDYDVRIQSDGGNNIAGRGTLSISADLVKLPALELTSPLGIAFGGTGSIAAEGARANLGLGDSATRNVGTAAGTVAAGDDLRLSTINNKTSGVVKGDLFTLDNNYGHSTRLITYYPGSADLHFGGMIIKRPNSQGWMLSQYSATDYEVQSVMIGIDAPGANVNWTFNRNGQAVGTWVNNSDSRIKKDIKSIPDPLDAMKKIRGCSWTRLDSGVTGFGFIAQEVRDVFPDAVHDFGQSVTLVDGKEVENVLSVDTSGLSAALHHEAILALMQEVEQLRNDLKNLKANS